MLSENEKNIQGRDLRPELVLLTGVTGPWEVLKSCEVARTEL